QRRPDQDRRPQPHRPGGQVQPAAAHRGRAGRVRPIPGLEGFLQPEEVNKSEEERPGNLPGRSSSGVTRWRMAKEAFTIYRWGNSGYNGENASSRWKGWAGLKHRRGVG